MSDTKGHEHGISTMHEDTPQVIAGYGETAKREGAKTKEVRNVGVPGEFSFVVYSDQLIFLGRIICSHRGDKD